MLDRAIWRCTISEALYYFFVCVFIYLFNTQGFKWHYPNRGLMLFSEAIGLKQKQPSGTRRIPPFELLFRSYRPSVNKRLLSLALRYPSELNNKRPSYWKHHTLESSGMEKSIWSLPRSSFLIGSFSQCLWCCWGEQSPAVMRRWEPCDL